MWNLNWTKKDKLINESIVSVNAREIKKQLETKISNATKDHSKRQNLSRSNMHIRNKSASQKHNRRDIGFCQCQHYWPLRVWCKHMLWISTAHSEVIRMPFLPHDTVLLLWVREEYMVRKQRGKNQNVTLLRLVPKSFSMEYLFVFNYVDTVAMINADWYLHFTMHSQMFRY